MIRHLGLLAALAVLAAGCAERSNAVTQSPPSHPEQHVTPEQVSHATTPSPSPTRDPHATAALLRIATVFNNDYDHGDYGPVWDRWDARSQAIITRTDYIQRHTECPDSPQSVSVEDARRGPGGAWIVDYGTGGVQLHDYWYYRRGRWVFDLPLSNPQSVHVYKLTPEQYVAELGCAH